MDVGTPSILSVFLGLVHSYTSPNVLGQVMREENQGVNVYKVLEQMECVLLYVRQKCALNFFSRFGCVFIGS